MLFTKLLLENVLSIQPCNYGAASEPLLPKVARCVPGLSSRYMGQYAASVLKRSALTNDTETNESVWQAMFACFAKALRCVN